MKYFLVLLVFVVPQLLQAAEPEPYPLSPDQLKWGETQIKRMLHDRPAMKKYVRKGDPLWDWTVRQFAGEWAKGGVEWDPTDPKKLWDGMYWGAGNGRKARIQITERSVIKNFRFGKKKEGPQLWHQTIFELCNVRISNGPSAEVRRLAAQGKIDAEEYAFRTTLCEAVDTRKALRDVMMGIWVPNCEALKLEPWNDFHRYTGNVGVPVSSIKGFIRDYFSIDYANPNADKITDEDRVFHRKYYLDQYENEFKPWMKAHGVPIPLPISLVELKQKMIDELVVGLPPYPLNEEQLKFGEGQLRRMLKDRPAMAKYVREGDDLWKWTVRQFAGENCKDGVEWENEPPEGGFDSMAYWAQPEEGKKAGIRLTKRCSLRYFHHGELKEAPELWYEAAIELCNLMESRRFRSIEKDAAEGAIGRQDYIFRMMAVEDISTNDHIHDFMNNVWAPHCVSMGLPPKAKRFIERWGDAPVQGWPKEKFLDAFSALTGERPEGAKAMLKGGYVEKDLKAHYDYYAARYDRYSPALLKEKGVEAAPDQNREAKEAFLASLTDEAIGSPAKKKLEPEGGRLLVGDFETGQIRNALGGEWLQYADQNNLGTKLGREYFIPSKGGCPGSEKYAGRLWGHFGKCVAPWPFAQLWSGLGTMERPADISAFSSVRFYAKGDGRPYLLAISRVAVDDYANYQSSFGADHEWKQVVLPLEGFQQPSWGKRVAKGWEDVVNLIFGVDSGASSDKDFDLWIDDVELVK